QRSSPPPASTTVRTACPERWRRRPRGRHSSSSTRIRDQRPLAETKCSPCLLARDAWEIVEKGGQRAAGPEVDEQRRDRHAGPPEDGSPVHDEGIDEYERALARHRRARGES